MTATKAQLLEQIDLLENAVKELQEANAALIEENQILKDQMTDMVKAEKQGQPKPIELPKPFEYKSKLWKFNRPAFVLGGNKYKSQDVLQNAEILDALIAKETTILTEVIEDL